jgi:surfactin synthase thioesterase subunit
MPKKDNTEAVIVEEVGAMPIAIITPPIVTVDEAPVAEMVYTETDDSAFNSVADGLFSKLQKLGLTDDEIALLGVSSGADRAARKAARKALLAPAKLDTPKDKKPAAAKKKVSA